MAPHSMVFSYDASRSVGASACALREDTEDHAVFIAVMTPLSKYSL